MMNEFMGGASTSFHNVKSVFTLALFEDTGWCVWACACDYAAADVFRASLFSPSPHLFNARRYKADYSHVDSLKWGYKYGCDFLSSCNSDALAPRGFWFVRACVRSSNRG